MRTSVRALALLSALLCSWAGGLSADTTVKEVATRWGFSHLGRFSRDYQRRFGEAPSETLSRGAKRK